VYVLLKANGQIDQFPYSITDLRNDNPDTSFGTSLDDASLADFRVFPVEPTDQPETSKTERAVVADPEFVDGQWQQRWTIEPMGINEAKAVLWERAKFLRDQFIDAGVNLAGIGVFDSDAPSRGNINGAVTMALVAQISAQPFSIDWKLADNSVKKLNGAQMIAAGIAVGKHVAECHEFAQKIGIAILNAKNNSELNAINIEDGWP